MIPHQQPPTHPNVRPFHEEIAEARAKIPPRIIFKNNFIGGLAWGLGSVIGATVLVAILGLIISVYGDIPVLGNIITFISQAIQRGTTSIPK